MEQPGVIGKPEGTAGLQLHQCSANCPCPCGFCTRKMWRIFILLLNGLRIREDLYEEQKESLSVSLCCPAPRQDPFPTSVGVPSLHQGMERKLTWTLHILQDEAHAHLYKKSHFLLFNPLLHGRKSLYREPVRIQCTSSFLWTHCSPSLWGQKPQHPHWQQEGPSLPSLKESL